MKRPGIYVLGAAGIVLALAAAVRVGRSDHGAQAGATPSAAASAPAPDMLPGLESRVRGNGATVGDWQALAAAYFDRGRFADAARSYARATTLAPDNAENWSALGETLVRRDNGVGDDAAHAFRRALSIDPRDARARYFMAVQQDMKGDHRGAIDAWIALLREAPAGAAWAPTVRALVEQVAAKQKIDIAGRLPPANALGGPPAAASFNGAAVAADGIPGPDESQLRDAARLSPSEQDAMAHAMVDRLAARLAADPKDAAGWMRLMRARLVLGDKAGAGKALADARRAFAGDAATLAQLNEAAGALGMPR